MARTGNDSGSAGVGETHESLTFQANGQGRIELPSADFIADAKMTRDGDDLILQTPNGQTAVIEGYFDADPAPLLQSADGATLTPNLVDAFSRSPFEFAAKDTASDESPVGAVEEVKGNCTVTRADGTVETITIGTPIYQGDIVETDASGAVNIVFIDETSMAVSENARLAIDEYTFDPATESGTTNFSVLRGLFVFTSGLIGRDDPDDVTIDTPVGSIGIRGTVIAGDINPAGESKITVLEGAIVVTNSKMEAILSEQFQTIRLGGFDEPMHDMGVVPANDIGTRFHSIGDVSPSLFTTINDAAKEQAPTQQHNSQPAVEQPSTNEQQSQSQEQTTTQEAAPVAPPPVSMDTGLSNSINGDSSGLPSQNVVAGEPAHGSPSTGSSGHGSSGSAGSATPSTGSGGNAHTTPSASAETPLPPPASTDSSNGGTTTPGTPAGSTLALSFTGGTFADTIDVGHVVGRITHTAGMTVDYTISSAYFTVVSDSTGANIILSTAGVTALNESLDKVDLGSFSITATEVGGTTQSVTRSFATTTTDSHTAANSIDLSGPAASQKFAIISDGVNNKIGYGIIAMGDKDDDGFDDFAFINDSGNANQSFLYNVSGRSGVMNSSNYTGLGGTVTNSLDTAVSFTQSGLVGAITGFNLPADVQIVDVLIDGIPVSASGFSYNASTGILDFVTAPTGTITIRYANVTDTNIASIGDFNGDGVEDYIIGQASNYVQGSGNLQTGNAYVVSGADPNMRMKFSGSVTSGGLIGSSVDGVGDFNNDGYADVIIGAPGIDTVYFLAGRSNSGFTPPIQSTAQPINGAGGFGMTVAGLGDFNGDGYADFAVGAPSEGGGGTNGTVRIYMGNANGTFSPTVISGNPGDQLGSELFSLGDINGDGKTDLMIGGTNNIGQIWLGTDSVGTTADANIVISNNYTVTGGGAVGDFNGDGYDDFALSMADGTKTFTYVVYGKESWAGTTVNLDYLKNSENAFEIRYNGANDSHGLEISALGDVNGDGYDDFGIGLPDANGGLAGDGGVAVIYGRGTGNVTSGLLATGNAQSLVGNGSANQLSDNGFENISLRGGGGNDTFLISDTNFRNIDGGAGSLDIIRAMGNLDFSNIDFEQVTRIEGIQFGAANQTVTLTMENLFNLMKTSDTGILRISANSMGDSNLIFTDGDGTDNYVGSGVDQMIAFLEDASGGTTPVVHSTATAGYDTFKIGGYTLMVDQAITVDAQ